MPPSRRSPLPAGLAAVLSCALLSSCRDRAGDQPAVVNKIADERPSIPVVERPLDREQLLLAALRAASAFAAGNDDSAAQRKLDGKRFELRLRFGCGEAETADEVRGWRFDERQRALRLRITPDISADDPVAAAIAGEAFESVEGFWLRRPWLLTPACPRPPAPAADAPAAEAEARPNATAPPSDTADQGPAPAALGRRLGIAQFFSPADSRTGRRRQRPYESTTVLNEGQKPSATGYDFVVSGRLRALPDRRVIACTANNGPEVPPACIISVDVDRAWIERPDNRALIAEWSGG